MSCDHAVWFPHKRLTNEEAGRLYAELCQGNVAGVEAHPSLDAFHAELVARHPEIDDVPEEQIDDLDVCPWSIAFDRSPGHIIMCCAWPKADYVNGLLKTLARKHGLALYDPQAERIHYPDEAPSQSKPWWKLW